MYEIYAGNLLIGYSALESGDPPMGVASGVFEPTSQFCQLSEQGVRAVDGAGRPVPDMLVWEGLSAKTPAGAELECQGGVSIMGYCPAGSPWELEVSCLGIPYPLYEDLFPDHVKGYRNAFP